MDEIAALTEGLPGDLAGMLRALAELCGGREVLSQAREVLAGAPAPVQTALADITAIADSLAARFPQLPLYFDLGELRGYHYHTGVVFAAFVPGVGESIAQGGRYDDIGADFGRARPATGFSTDLKTLVTLGRAQLDEPRTGVWGAGRWRRLVAGGAAAAPSGRARGTGAARAGCGFGYRSGLRPATAGSRWQLAGGRALRRVTRVSAGRGRHRTSTMGTSLWVRMS